MEEPILPFPDVREQSGLIDGDVHVVRIRMQRMGRTHKSFFRINAIEKRVKRDGKVLENLGWYDPNAKDPEKQLVLNDERVKHWLEQGAQATDTVKDILAKRNLIDAEAWKAERRARVQPKIDAMAKAKAAAEEKAAADAKAKAEAEAAKAAEAAAKAAAEAKAKADAEAAKAAEAKSE